ncbi:MAG: purine phosphoribosyltransferase family protein [Methanocellales archaeon]|nr:purine phosphoribosyltransferase family protein [Methanocellales archaeon]
MLDRLKESLLNAPVIKRGDYYYFIHPITDGVPELRSDLIREVSAYILKIANMDVDKIVTIEAMGIHIGTALSLLTDIPLVIIRKRKYELPGEIVVNQSTGYSKDKLYMNGVFKGDKVMIVDDVISTGGTIQATIKAIETAGAEIKDIVAVISRGEGEQKIKERGHLLKVLIRVDVSEGNVILR